MFVLLMTGLILYETSNIIHGGETNYIMAGILSTMGYTLHPILVIEACSGKYSGQLLDNDDTRYVASMIPCRVAIYQTSPAR